MSGSNIKYKIGIFGGSFDPVHLGHVSLAEDAVKQAELDRIVFIPAAIQPFKLDKRLAGGDARLEMLRLAVSDTGKFDVSSYELDEKGISYSYLTMRAMQKKFGEEARLYFITGTDAFLKINKWKNAEEMLTKYSFIIGTRPGYRQEELKSFADKMQASYNTEILNIDNIQIDVSSTEIRSRLKRGLSVEGLVTEKVERYIKKNGLYR